MLNKKKTALFAVFASAALLIAPLLTLATAPLNETEATTVYHEKWTSLAEGGTKPYVVTKGGGIIEFNLNNHNPDKPLTDGFYEMQEFEVISNHTDIGGIKKLELELEVNNITYVESPGDEAPLSMKYMYYIRNEHSGMREEFNADPGFRTVYEWTQGYPSCFMLTCNMERVKIKSLAIDYTCKHENIEHTLNPNDIYMLGGIQGSYCDSAHKGYNLDYDDSKKEYHVTLDLFNLSDGFTYAYFRHPATNNELKISLKESADNYCAVKEGLVKATPDSDTRLEIERKAYYDVYLKPTTTDVWDVYIKTNPQSLKNWYLVGNEFTIDGQAYGSADWTDNSKGAKFVKNPDEQLIFELNNVSLTKDKLIKVRNDTKTLWTNNINSESVTYVEKTLDGNNNLKVLQTGIYNIKVRCDAGYPYIEFIKVVNSLI